VAKCAEPRLTCGGACAAPACGGLHGFPGAPAHGIIGPVALGDVDGDGVLDIAGGDWGLGVALGKGQWVQVSI
jgi:hypothetical protein